MKIENISFRYNGKPVFEDVSFSLNKGEFLGILGVNGAGKSTLLKLMRGLLKPTEGSIFYKDILLRDWKLDELCKEMAYVPQGLELFVPMTAMRLVSLGRTPYLKGWFEDRKDMDAIRHAMSLTDIMDLSAREYHTLSGGEKRRVILAKALAQEPDVLFLDEPTDDLDIRHQGEFLSILKSFRENGMTVAMTTHNINIVSEYCDRVIILNDNGVFASGRPEEVITEKVVNEAFGWETTVDRNPLTGKPRVTPVYK